MPTQLRYTSSTPVTVLEPNCFAHAACCHCVVNLATNIVYLCTKTT